MDLDTDIPETPCDDHRCDSCAVCRRGACCRRDRADWQLPEMGSWPGAVFGEFGVLARDARGAQCHICGRMFRMLATHVWRTHQVWAEEYRAYFGLSAKRGLVGADTSAKLRAAATEYLVPYHEAAVELARAATRGKPLRERGPRIRLETRLDPVYQAAMRNRGLRTAEIMQERLKDPDQRDRLREQLRSRGPTSVVCTECGTAFMSRLQGASSRKVILCGEGCRGRRKQAARAPGALERE